MNYTFYRSLMLSHTFFKWFGSIRYRRIPVARAMFYGFHRNASRSLKPTKRTRWVGKKKRLYKQLIATDRVRAVPYKPSRRKPGKTLYTIMAAEGLPLNRRNTVLIGQGRAEAKKGRKRNLPTYIPSLMSPMNVRSYRAIMRKFSKIVRNKKVPARFRTRSFRIWFARQLPSILRIIDGMQKVFNNHRITGIVLHSSVHPLGYLLAHMGRQRGIPTFTLQYGINDDYQLLSTYTQHYLAWGKTHRKRLTQYGVPGRKFALLGSPRFDSLFRKSWGNKAQLAKRLKIPRRKVIFVYPEQPLGLAKNRKTLRIIRRALHPFRRKAVLVVKMHPKQRQRTLPRAMVRKNRHIKVVRGRNPHLYRLLKGADGVLVQFSTTGLEAMLLNRPIIAMRFFPNTLKHEFTYYSASKLITSASGQRQLRSILQRFVRRQNYRRLILRKQKRYRAAAYQGTLSIKRVKRYIQSHSNR